MPKSVRFSDVQIREYPMILGDHPGPKKGLPVTLAWKHQNEDEYHIEMYEFLRRKKRRPRKKLRLKWDYRHEYLSSLGEYKPSEFVKVLMANSEIKESRMKNSGVENMDLFDSFMSGSGRALRWSSGFASSAVAGTKAVANISVDGTKAVARGTVEGTKAVAKGTFDATVYTANTAVKAVTTVGTTGTKGLVKVGNGLVKVMTIPVNMVRDGTTGRHSSITASTKAKPTAKALQR